MDPIAPRTPSPRLIGKCSTQLRSDFPDSFCPNQLAQLIDQQSTRPSTTLCHVLDLLRFYGCVPSCTLLSVPWYTVVLPAWYTVVCTLWNPLKANRISWWSPKDDACGRSSFCWVFNFCFEVGMGSIMKPQRKDTTRPSPKGPKTSWLTNLIFNLCFRRRQGEMRRRWVRRKTGVI